jgi:hypothetical protein
VELDEETLEALGYGGRSFLELNAAPTTARRESVKLAWVRYSKSQKGKEATARRDAKRKSSTYFADYYSANREKVRARVKKWQSNMSDAQRAKRAAYDKARYARRKTK